jgi:hypothetical protein
LSRPRACRSGGRPSICRCALGSRSHGSRAITKAQNWRAA